MLSGVVSTKSHPTQTQTTGSKSAVHLTFTLGRILTPEPQVLSRRLVRPPSTVTLPCVPFFGSTPLRPQTVHPSSVRPSGLSLSSPSAGPSRPLGRRLFDRPIQGLREVWVDGDSSVSVSTTWGVESVGGRR